MKSKKVNINQAKIDQKMNPARTDQKMNPARTDQKMLKYGVELELSGLYDLKNIK